MTKLTLSPEAAAARAARKAAKAAQHTNPPPIVAPAPPSASPRAGPNKHGRLKAELDALEAKLRRVWPHCFTEPVPLAVGIRYDIAKHLSADEQKLLPGVLHRWVKRKSYLQCVRAAGCPPCRSRRNPDADQREGSHLRPGEAGSGRVRACHRTSGDALSRPPGNWRPAPECKPLWLHRTRCCWCHRQSPNRPTAFYVMADGDDPFAAVASPVCARCAK